jgi:hypothetical protein
MELLGDMSCWWSDASIQPQLQLASRYHCHVYMLVLLSPQNPLDGTVDFSVPCRSTPSCEPQYSPDRLTERHALSLSSPMFRRLT